MRPGAERDVLHGAPGALPPRDAPRWGAFELVAPRPITQRILLAYDASPGSEAALAWAGRLARDAGAPVTVVGVRVPAYVPVADGGPGLWAVGPPASAAAEDAADQLRLVGVDADVHVDVGAAAERILWAARLHDADLVIVGAARQAMPGGLGRVARALVSGASTPVLVAREGPRAGAVLAFGRDAGELGARVAKTAGLPFLTSSLADEFAMAELARGVRAGLAVASAGERFAALAPCSVLLVR